MDWYQTQNEYNEQKTKNKKRRNRIIGAVVLALLIGAGIFFLIKNTHVNISFYSSEDGEAGEKMPDDFKEFFDSYYSTTTTDSAEINLPVYDGPEKPQLEIELKESGGEAMSLQDIYDKCSPVIVSVTGTMGDKEGTVWGSGIIVSEDGLIVTNTHVVEKIEKAVIQLPDGGEYEAKIVGADAVSDIALLKVEPEGKLPVAEFADTSSLNEGDEVAAIGNPLGPEFRNTLTNGIISAIDRGISYNGHSMTLLQTNTAINEGNSGGALFNMNGQVVGITNMKMMSYYSSIEGIGFAIPSTTVKAVVSDLIKYGYVPRTSIGITVGPVPETAKKNFNLPEGLYVSDVTEGSDAEKQGIQVGDVITAVNGQKVTQTTEVNDVKDKLSLGDSITFTIYRKDTGETFDLSVKLMDYRELYK